MGKYPVLKPRQGAAILEKLGFVEARQRGSHKQFRHPDGPSTTVPFHGSRDISPVLLRLIAKDIRLTMEEQYDSGAESAPMSAVVSWSECSLLRNRRVSAAQHVFLNLARRGLRQFVNERYRLWRFEVGQVRPGKVA